jgi:hypothetical protein
MGFTVAGPNRFFGSGHPDVRAAREGSPARLGLIRSTDGGNSWTPISLEGQVDFHILRAVGTALYGVDSSTSSLLMSSDLGRNWQRRNLPADVVDLVPHPERPRILVAATQRGLEWSGDAGRPAAERTSIPKEMTSSSAGDGAA